MILFFTDMYDSEGDLHDFIRKLKTPRNEVIVFHLIGREELELNYSTQLTFEDLETGERLKVDSPTQQSVYRKKMGDWVDATRDWMLQKQVIYQPTYLDDPAPEVLRTFLKARKSMIR
jgi:hypothetical protein